MRKFVTQLVRRLPKKSADALPEAAERLEVKQAQVAILLPREPVIAALVMGPSQVPPPPPPLTLLLLLFRRRRLRLCILRLPPSPPLAVAIALLLSRAAPAQ